MQILWGEKFVKNSASFGGTTIYMVGGWYFYLCEKGKWGRSRGSFSLKA